MAKKQRNHAQSVSNETNDLSLIKRRTAVSLAVAAALSGAPMLTNVAYAQDDEPIEEIITIGVRMSILDSVAAKRNADTVADIVDAGALGSLPDQSIADALGRVPGVTTVRGSGQSSQLNIRGMNGDFIQTTLNGREQASTSGYTESTRWMAFDQYPAELITQAAVYKSPKASFLEGGVAGIVDLKTVNPLDAQKEHNLVVTGRLSQNDAADDIGGDDQGYRFSLSYQGSSQMTPLASLPVSPTSNSRMHSSSAAPAQTASSATIMAMTGTTTAAMITVRELSNGRRARALTSALAPWCHWCGSRPTRSRHNSITSALNSIVVTSATALRSAA